MQNRESNSIQNSNKGIKRKFLVFMLDDKRYAIPLTQIKEVIGMSEITPLPNVPAYYLGLINIRGQIISVIDLRLKLGFSKKQFNPKESSIIIVHVGDIVIGVFVDKLIEVLGFFESDLDLNEQKDQKKQGDGVYGVAKNGGDQLTILIDLKECFLDTGFKIFKNELR